MDFLVVMVMFDGNNQKRTNRRGVASTGEELDRNEWQVSKQASKQEKVNQIRTEKESSAVPGSAESQSIIATMFGLCQEYGMSSPWLVMNHTSSAQSYLNHNTGPV